MLGEEEEEEEEEEKAEREDDHSAEISVAAAMRPEFRTSNNLMLAVLKQAIDIY